MLGLYNDILIVDGFECIVTDALSWFISNNDILQTKFKPKNEAYITYRHIYCGV